MEKIVEQGLLYDFYGELLTDHQRKIYEDVVYNDLSLTEIAEENGISRQGVHDLVRRCNHILQDYEDKLHLVEKFLTIKAKVQNMNEIIDLYESTDESTRKLASDIRKISDEIIEEL